MLRILRRKAKIASRNSKGNYDIANTDYEDLALSSTKKRTKPSNDRPSSTFFHPASEPSDDSAPTTPATQGRSTFPRSSQRYNYDDEQNQKEEQTLSFSTFLSDGKSQQEKDNNNTQSPSNNVKKIKPKRERSPRFQEERDAEGRLYRAEDGEIQSQETPKNKRAAPPPPKRESSITDSYPEQAPTNTVVLRAESLNTPRSDRHSKARSRKSQAAPEPPSKPVSHTKSLNRDRVRDEEVKESYYNETRTERSFVSHSEYVSKPLRSTYSKPDQNNTYLVPLDAAENDYVNTQQLRSNSGVLQSTPLSQHQPQYVGTYMSSPQVGLKNGNTTNKPQSTIIYVNESETESSNLYENVSSEQKGQDSGTKNKKPKTNEFISVIDLDDTLPVIDMTLDIDSVIKPSSSQETRTSHDSVPKKETPFPVKLSDSSPVPPPRKHRRSRSLSPEQIKSTQSKEIYTDYPIVTNSSKSKSEQKSSSLVYVKYTSEDCVEKSSNNTDGTQRSDSFATEPRMKTSPSNDSELTRLCSRLLTDCDSNINVSTNTSNKILSREPSSVGDTFNDADTSKRDDGNFTVTDSESSFIVYSNEPVFRDSSQKLKLKEETRTSSGTIPKPKRSPKPFENARSAGVGQDAIFRQSLPGNKPDSSILLEDDYTPHISSLSFLDTTVSSDSEDSLSDSGFTPHPWETTPINEWNNQDVCEWCEAKDLDYVSRILKGQPVTGMELMAIDPDNDQDFQGLNKAERQQFTRELETLKIASTSPTLYRIKKSGRRKGEKVASDNKLKMEECQQLKSTQYVPEYEHDRSEGNKENIGDYTYSHKNYLQLPLYQWSNADVLHWLGTAGLEKFIDSFAENGITGRELAEINMKLLDDIDIKTTADRELLLSKLYQLQQPRGAPLDVILSTSDTPTQPTDTHNMKPGNEKGSSLYIYHSLKGSVERENMQVSNSTTSSDIITSLLEKYDVHQDSNLLYLQMKKASGEVYDLGRFECLLSTSQTLKGNNKEFHLCRRPGIQIKVLCHVAGVNSSVKAFDVAAESTPPEVLQLALNKFRLSHVDPQKFCLLELNTENGEITEPEEFMLMANRRTGTFVLCDKTSQELMLKDDDYTALSHFKKPSSFSKEDAPIIRDRSSDVKETADSPLVPTSQVALHDLESQMATIEASLSRLADHASPKEGAILEEPTASRPDSIDMLQEIALLRENLKVKDKKIQQLSRTIETIKSENAEWSRNNATLLEMEEQLSEISQIIEDQESKRNIIINQLDGAFQGEDEGLRTELTTIDGNLLTLKQKHATLFADIELRRKQGQNKEKQIATRISLYDILNDGEMKSIQRFEIPRQGSGFGFLIGRSQQDRPVVKQVVERSVLKKGDRLVEINGKTVAGLDEKEVNDRLKETTNVLKLVVLRKSHEETDEMKLENLKEDLSLAMMEVEAVTQENKDVVEEMHRLKNVHRQTLEEKEELVIENHKKDKLVKDYEQRWGELRQIIEQINMDPSTLDDLLNKSIGSEGTLEFEGSRSVSTEGAHS